LKKPKLCIFDFDGTLIDSEPNYDASSLKLFEHLGIMLTFEQRRAFVGVGASSFAKALKQMFDLSHSEKEIMALCDDFYLDIARKNTPIFQPVLDLLIAFQAMGIPSVIASGSTHNVLTELTQSTGIINYIDAIYSSQIVPLGKPAPDIFLHVAKDRGIDPADCLVIEDSIPGVIAAHQAKMPVIAVPEEHYFAQSIFQSAWLCFPGPQHLSVKAVLAGFDH
jgi:HAD superfamily hydrolase (TIGR01509 family)